MSCITIPITTGAAIAKAGLRLSTESRIAKQVNASSGGIAVAQLALDQQSSCVRGDHLAGQSDQGLVADENDAADDRADREHDEDAEREGDSSDRLRPEDLGAADRAGEHRLPGAHLILSGEDVPGHERGQKRQHPLAREAEDQQRHRPAGLVDVAAEQAVLRRPLLALQDDHDQDRRDRGKRERQRARASA